MVLCLKEVVFSTKKRGDNIKRSFAILFLTVLVWTISAGATTPLVKDYEERAYLAQRGPITMCVDPDWLPYERIDKSGKHIGIAADYMDLFSNMIGKKINLVPTKTWSESEQFGRERKCDILSLLNQSKERDEYLNFTDPYVEATVVLVARKDVPFIDGMKGLVGKSLGIVKDYVYEGIIRERYPDVNIVYVESMDDAFQKVSEGKIFATIGSLFIVTSRIQELSLSNLKLAGSAEFKTRLRVGVRNDDPLLLGLFQKAVENIDPKAENEILRRWISVKLEHGTDYTLVFQVIGVGVLIIGLLIYRHLSVSRLVKELNTANALLERRKEELKLLSRTDSLTKLHNRMHLDERLEEETMRCTRYDETFSCIMLDVDDFKRVNDQHGHEGGDAVLKALSRLLETHVRINDTLGRWGGEEFIIACPQTDIEGAHMLAEHLRELIQNHRFDYIRQITCSFGVAEFKKGDTSATLISRTDVALYKAKNGGRNKVCLG